MGHPYRKGVEKVEINNGYSVEVDAAPKPPKIAHAAGKPVQIITKCGEDPVDLMEHECGDCGEVAEEIETILEPVDPPYLSLPIWRHQFNRLVKYYGKYARRMIRDEQRTLSWINNSPCDLGDAADGELRFPPVPHVDPGDELSGIPSQMKRALAYQDNVKPPFLHERMAEADCAALWDVVVALTLLGWNADRLKGACDRMWQNRLANDEEYQARKKQYQEYLDAKAILEAQNVRPTPKSIFQHNLDRKEKWKTRRGRQRKMMVQEEAEASIAEQKQLMEEMLRGMHTEWKEQVQCDMDDHLHCGHPSPAEFMEDKLAVDLDRLPPLVREAEERLRLKESVEEWAEEEQPIVIPANFAELLTVEEYKKSGYQGFKRLKCDGCGMRRLCVYMDDLRSCSQCL